MKKYLLILLVLSSGTLSVFSQQFTIKWNTNVDYAKNLSKDQNKPLLFFFMDEPAGTLSSSVKNNTLTNNLLVEKINSQFIPIIVRGDTVLEREYGITRIPTLLVVGSNGIEIDRLTGVIGIDQAFGMLESAVINYANTNTKPGTSKTTTTNSATNIGSVFNYENGVGSFVKIDEKNWEHRTPFYTIKYVQIKEDNRYYYIVSADNNGEKKTNVAIPKSVGITLWVWQDDKNSWESSEKITTIDSSVSR